MAIALTAPHAKSAAVVGFSSLGHFYNHLFEPIFFVVALALPAVLGIPYEEVLTLIIAGKILTGILAPLVGWVSDRWNAPAMMAIYFLGYGACAIAVGLTSTPLAMMLALAALGAFGAIYHPVGIAWMVAGAENRGRALGINGMFGGFGPAVAGIVAGALVQWANWRAAFIVPGALVILTGLALLATMRRGGLPPRPAPRPGAHADVSAAEAVRIYVLLTAAMVVNGFIYQATQASLPKLFAGGLDGLLGPGTAGVGTALMIVYGAAGLFQVWTGHLADRHALKWVYAGALLLQAPVLALVTAMTGAPLVAVAAAAVMLNTGALPAENSLMAFYAPARWQATAYGLKFIIAFTFSGLGIWIAAKVLAATGAFTALYLGMAAAIALGAAVVTFLPGEGTRRAAAAAAE
jgi:MFS family permease